MNDTVVESKSEQIPDLPDPGRQLREGREARGLSLADVAERTRIRQVYLQAFESMDLDQLPAAPYAIGFLRQYARLLQIDTEQIVGDFRLITKSGGKIGKAHAESVAVLPKCPPAQRTSRRFPFRWFVGLLLLGSIGWLAYSKGDIFRSAAQEATVVSEQSNGATGGEENMEAPEPPDDTVATVRESVPAEAAASPIPAVTEEAAAPVPSPGQDGILTFELPRDGGVFRIASKGQGWVEIEADGRPLQTYEMQNGTRVEWHIHELAEIRMNISGGMQAWVDGREVSLPPACRVMLRQGPDRVPTVASGAAQRTDGNATDIP